MVFPCNVDAVTVWEKTVVNHAPAYVPHVLGPSCWQDTRGQTLGAEGRESADNVFLAVPAHSLGDYLPKKDDRIAPGASDAVKPPPDALTVMQVKDWRESIRASAGMRHIEVRMA